MNPDFITWIPDLNRRAQPGGRAMDVRPDYNARIATHRPW